MNTILKQCEDKMNGVEGWRCPGQDDRALPDWLLRRGEPILSQAGEMKLALEKLREGEPGNMILPLVQNLEAAVYGAGVARRGSLWTVGDYCYESLEELREAQFHLLRDERIQAVLQVIRDCGREPAILEVEAPFSVLGGLVDPMALYGCQGEEQTWLERILRRIGEDQAAYVGEAARAGCRVFSIADPVGNRDLVGEDFYRRFSGRAAAEFLKKVEKYFAGKALMHLCGRMSQSLVSCGFASVFPYPAEAGKEYCEALFEAAERKEIHFIGQGCIHAGRLERPVLYRLELS